MAKEHNVPSAWKNGPRGWTLDKNQLPVGKEAQDFDGLKAAWFAYPEYPPDFILHHAGITASAWKVTQVKRNSTEFINGGNVAFILDDPNGNPWVMQAWSSQVDPSLNYDALASMGPRLTPPTDWEYRGAVTLPKTLQIVAPGGTATITQDNLGNSYDECTSATCNYIP